MHSFLVLSPSGTFTPPLTGSKSVCHNEGLRRLRRPSSVSGRGYSEGQSHVLQTVDLKDWALIESAPAEELTVDYSDLRGGDPYIHSGVKK